MQSFSGSSPGESSHEGTIFDIPTEGDTRLALDANRPDFETSGPPRLCFWNRDMAATVAHLQHLSVEITSEVEDIGSVCFVQVKDPGGKPLMVCQRARSWRCTAKVYRSLDGTRRRLLHGSAAAASGTTYIAPLAVWLGDLGSGWLLAINVSNVGRAVPSFAVLLLLSIRPVGTDDLGPYGRSGPVTEVGAGHRGRGRPPRSSPPTEAVAGALVVAVFALVLEGVVVLTQRLVNPVAWALRQEA